MTFRFPWLAVLFFAATALLTACGKPLWYVDVPPETVHQEMLERPNDDTITWWYAGHDGSHHHFVMKKASTWPHDGYRVPDGRLRLADKDELKIDFPSAAGDWAQVSAKDLVVRASALEQAVTTPDRVRQKIQNLPNRSLDLESGDEDEEDDDF